MKSIKYRDEVQDIVYYGVGEDMEAMAWIFGSNIIQTRILIEESDTSQEAADVLLGEYDIMIQDEIDAMISIADQDQWDLSVLERL